MSGWYRLHRGWQDHGVFRNEVFSRRDAFVWLIEHASYGGGKVPTAGGTITLERGQLSYSLRYMAAAWKWDDPKVRRFLASLVKASIIDTATDAGQTVVTIQNYAKYQATERRPDAATDARTTQPRRTTDANKKEGEEREQEGGRADARSAAGYAFSGEVVRLTQKDFTEWKGTYHAIPDLKAELASIDAWFISQPAEDRGSWFHRAKRMLNTAHQRALTAHAGQGGRSGVVVPIDDAFERRLARAQAAGSATG